MSDNRLESLKRLFWRSFFRLVVFTGALAQWACLAWVLVVIAGLQIPWAMHVAAPLLLHTLNRRLLGGPRPGPANLRRSPMDAGVHGRRLHVVVRPRSCCMVNGAIWSLVAAVFGAASQLGAPVAAADVLGAAGTTGSLALIVTSSLVAWGYGPGQRHVRIVELDVAIPGLPEAFDGFRLAQLSDIHLGGYMDDASLASHVRARELARRRPDVHHRRHHRRTRPCAADLPHPRAPRAPCGVVAILGNHDFYTGAEAVTDELQRLTTIRVLRDEDLVIERDGARLHVLGVDDAGLDWTRGVREHEALPPLVAAVPEGDAMRAAVAPARPLRAGRALRHRPRAVRAHPRRAAGAAVADGAPVFAGPLHQRLPARHLPHRQTRPST